MMYEIASNRFISTPTIALANEDISNSMAFADASKEMISSLQKDLANERELVQSLETRIRAIDYRSIDLFEVETQTDFVMDISIPPQDQKVFVKLAPTEDVTDPVVKRNRLSSRFDPIQYQQDNMTKPILPCRSPPALDPAVTVPSFNQPYDFSRLTPDSAAHKLTERIPHVLSNLFAGTPPYHVCLTLIPSGKYPVVHILSFAANRGIPPFGALAPWNAKRNVNLNHIVEVQLASQTNAGDLPLCLRTWNKRRLIPELPASTDEFVRWAEKHNLSVKDVDIEKVARDLYIRRNFFTTGEMNSEDQALVVENVQPVYENPSRFNKALLALALFSFNKNDACDLLFCVSRFRKHSIYKQLNFLI